MDIGQLREYCISKAHTFECLPFGDDSLVVKVGIENGKDAKMFALIPLDNPTCIVLKCDPDEAIRLREHHSEIQTAYHFNKRHWNSVDIDGDLETGFIMQMIDNSYALALESLTNKVRSALNG